MKAIFSNPISAGAQMSIKAFYHDFVNYMAENYSATPHQLMLDWNSVGATARYHGHTHIFEFRLWERSEGHLGIPDMTVIVSVFHISGSRRNLRQKPMPYLYGYAMRQKLTDSATSPTRATAPRTHRIRYPDAKSLV